MQTNRRQVRCHVPFSLSEAYPVCVLFLFVEDGRGGTPWVCPPAQQGFRHLIRFLLAERNID